MSPAGGIVLSVVSLLAGWVGLWPLRRHLGAVGYHLAAYPTGLVLWPVVAAVLSVLRVEYQPLLPYALATAALFAVARLVARDRSDVEGHGVPVWSYLVWGGGVVGVSAVIALTGYTAAGYDSLFNYEAWGVWIFDQGTLSRSIIGSFGALMPSVHAANRFFGSDWTATPYPVLSLHVAALVATAAARWARGWVGMAWSTAIALVALAFMVSVPSYVHHSLYVHSHMITAAYLLLALLGLQRAYLGAEDDGSSPSDTASDAWLLVAGLASAGLALTRTDGIAYVAIPAVVGTVLWLESGRSWRSQAIFVCAAAVPIATVYGSAFYSFGLWPAKKLSGKKAAAVLAGLILGSASTLVIGALPRVRAWLGHRNRALLLVCALEVVGLAGLVALRPSGFAESTRNMVTNLLRTGGYGYLWYFVFGAIAVSFAWGRQWRSGRWPLYLLFAIVQFFVIAAAVHGVGHPGRLNPADSFSRVAFHVVPLVFWYVAMVVATLVAEYRGR
ncbi:MAG: hypothetical protein Q8K99_06935 [Actinomycetota bacterium]|nr:hypothetical protein [Actinomycetota bacterium]